MSDNRLLVPVSDSGTLRQTVEYAVRTALEGETPTAIRFAYVHPPRSPPEDDGERSTHADADELLDRVTVWAREDAGEADVPVETAHLGTEQYVFSPSDVARVLVEEASTHNSRCVVLDPEYDPGVGAPLVRPLERELEAFEAVTVETAPVTPQTRRTPLLGRTNVGEISALFLVSFGFYQVLAGNFTWLAAGPTDWAAEIYWLDMVTGAVSATIVAVGLSQVVLGQEPNRQTVARLLRGVVYVPYLLTEIVKANVLIAAVILDPRLPIEPRLTRIRPALWGGLPVSTLANSITLTPGTLTVRIRGRHLLVHTLVPAAREDLFDGGLERGVRFVFYGRAAARIPGLRERGEADIVATDRGRPDDGAEREAGAADADADADGGVDVETTEDTGGDAE